MVPMHFANNNIPMAKLLLKYGAKSDTPVESVLAAQSTPEFIDFALEHGANLENQYYNGTVLSLAAYSGYLETVRHYLRRGANVNSRREHPQRGGGSSTNTGETPLHRATFSFRSKKVEKTVYTEIVRLLIEGGADVNAKTNQNISSDMEAGLVVQGETPLHFATNRGEAEMVQLLLRSGADEHAETALGETPLDYARKHQRSDAIIELLT